MDLVILIAGLAGLSVAAYAFASLAVDAVRHREFVDIVIAAAVAIAVVYVLIAYGDTLMR